MKKLYSFDLFDTLVTRKVNHPRDVFILIQATGIVKYKFLFFKLLSFKFLRVTAEKIARYISKKEDINIYDIYTVLSFFIKNYEEVLQKEIDLEISLLLPKEDNINILNELRNKGANICITSDMYLPKNIINQILVENNIFVDNVYVSSEYGLTKASGNLFYYIANDLKVSFHNILHYGDNLWSDVEVPRKLGINAIHIGLASVEESLDFFDCFKSSIQDDQYYKVGYEFCGPIAYSFAKFIKNNVDISSEKIVFGARDSYLFKYAFELFFNKDKKYKTYYTRISRKLVYLPEVYFSENFDRLFEGVVNCEDFFSRIHMQCPENLIGKLAWSNKKTIINFLENNEVFKKYLKEESELVKKYLIDNGFRGRVYFVDLGWRGSIQDSVNMILREEVNLRGLYLGTVNGDINKKGFLFENKRSFLNYFYVMQCISMFEYFFTEPVRSLSTVNKDNYNYLYIYTEDESDEQVESRKNIQKGCEQFLLDFYKLNKEFNFNEKLIESSLNKLLKRRTMYVNDSFVSSFKKLTHSAGFNGSLRSNMIEYDDFSIMSYLRSPWKAYYMSELRKYSKIRYFCLLFFHNIFFFIFYENFKFLYRKLRAIIRS